MPSDAAFRDALDALVAFVRVDERERTRHSGERNGVLIARARVLALYAERQGNGFIGTIILAQDVNAPDYVMLPQGHDYKGDDHVYVTKVEEGT